MTMKLATLLSVSMLATGSAFAAATAESSNVFGVLRVDSPYVRTIVAVPWVAAGVEAGDIKVTDIVKTANLSENDELHYYNGSGFDSWRLNASREWVPANQVSENGGSGTSPDADVQGLPRGGAILLIRPSATTDSYFFLQGQVGSGSVGSPSIATGSPTEPAYSLIAPPSLKESALNVNTDITWLGVGANDCLYILQGGGKTVECKFKGSAWKVGSWASNGDGPKTLTWNDPPAIPVGTGFWYVSKTTTAPTIAWKNVPTL